jgi:N-acetyl-anhydromuramyl-L-alanine amidase AmpD
MATQFETDPFPFVKARFFKETPGKRQVRLIVIHSMEAPEKGDTAENVAAFFHGGIDHPASAHLCIDNNSIVQCVLDNDIAFAAPGANNDGVHLELAGFARQSEGEWLDEYGKSLLEKAADAAAQYCLKYDIPVKHLTNAELANKANRGIVGHVQVSEVFKKSTHTDPGKGFPWEFFLERVKERHAQRVAAFDKA